ncbi:MAG TPA: magnesium transporter CorA family protein [Nitrospirae bacterium]|nr:magnesium transporter CorA family protein [Nitrospirota bacterium]
MIEFIKNSKEGLINIQNLEKGCWIKVTAPTEEDINYLINEIKVPYQFINYSCDEDENAKYDKIDNATLLIVDIPHKNTIMSEEPYMTRILGIVIMEDYVITICNYNTKVLEKLVLNYANRINTKKKNEFVLYILLATANKYLECLHKINETIEVSERSVRKHMRNEDLISLYFLQKSLVYFTVGLRSNQIMMQKLLRINLFDKFPEDRELLEDVIAEINQAKEMTEIANNILYQMMETFSYMIANTQNTVIKILTSVTILISIPTLIASIYGMNIPLPLSDIPYSFAIIIGSTTILTILIAYLFAKNKWL